MVIRTNIIALLLCILWSAPLSAATLDEAIETCGKKKGNAKTCCTMLLDETDEISQCVKAVSGKPAPPPSAAKPSRPPLPSGELSAGNVSGSATNRTSKSQHESAPRSSASQDSSLYSLGKGFPSHDISHLPVGDWKMKKDWGTSMSPIGNLTKAYGAKAADVKLFEKKLFAISDIIKEVPVLNPPRGCAPRLATAIDDVYDPTDQFSKKQPIRGQLIAGCFKLHDRKTKKNGVEITVWEPDHETRQYHILLNNLEGLYSGNTWTEGSSSIRPLEQVFAAPVKIGELQGFPIYARHIEQNGNPLFIFMVIPRPGVEPFLPVNREQFTKALVNTVEREFKEKESWRPPVQRSKELQDVLARYRQQLASLRPDEKEQQACYLNSKHLTWGEGSVPFGTQGCRPITRINPAIINPKAPRSAIQFVLVNDFEDIQERYLNAVKYKQMDGMSHFRTTIEMISQTDWKKIQNLIDKP